MKNYKAGKTRRGSDSIGGKSVAFDYFLPSKINDYKFQLTNPQITIALENATLLLGELKGEAQNIPDIDYFVDMHTTSEAVSSSEIEGTLTNLDETLLEEAEIQPSRRDDWHEVRNYINASNYAIRELQKTPVSERLIKGAHKILLQGARGKDKQPGKIRTAQNWLGGRSPQTARFVPPHHSHIAELLTDWAKFWHNQNLELPILIKIAICHYQFETIHPFLDGNGRIGRLLIMLQLIESDFLTQPIFYISNFIANNRQSYYDALEGVRLYGDLENWLAFFLEAVIQTATRSRDNLKRIIELRRDYENKIDKLGRRTSIARQLLKHLFAQPSVRVRDLEKVLGTKYDAANSVIKEFVKIGILQEDIKTTHGTRRFAMHEYIDLFRNR